MKECSHCGMEGLAEERRQKFEHVVVGCRVLLVSAVPHQFCTYCSHSIDIVPDQEGLIAAVATWRVMQPARLSPRELQLLRKATGLRGSEFADKAKLSAESLSRWENGKEPMSAQTERFLRLHIGLILKKRPHAMEMDVSGIMEMDLVPFSDTSLRPLPKFERVVAKDFALHQKTREWDAASEDSLQAA